jgi:hypothetical protein
MFRPDSSVLRLVELTKGGQSLQVHENTAFVIIRMDFLDCLIYILSIYETPRDVFCENVFINIKLCFFQNKDKNNNIQPHGWTVEIFKH